VDTTIPDQGTDPQASKEADPHIDLNQTPEVKTNQENLVIDVAEATMTKMIAISRTKLQQLWQTRPHLASMSHPKIWIKSK
jgi:hypothetical protein